MKNEIDIPEGVDIKISGKRVAVAGPKGEIEKNFSFPMFDHAISIVEKDGKLEVTTTSKKKKAAAMIGTIAAHVRNMIIGVTDGYSYELAIIYTHFPISVAEKDGVIEVKNFLGEKGIRKVKVHGKCKLKIDKEHITVSGSNVDDVGQTAANIERACKLRGRDRRIFQDGIFLSKRKLESGKEI